MLPDRVSNPGTLTYESGALPIALRGPALTLELCIYSVFDSAHIVKSALPRVSNTLHIHDEHIEDVHE